VKDNDPFFPDEIGRFITTQKGHSIANCHYPMTGKQLKETLIPRTISEAISLGKAMETFANGNDKAFARIVEFLGATALLKGRVVSCSEKTEGGFFWAEAIIAGIDESTGHSMRLLMKNEVMAAWMDEALISVFPDHVDLVNLEIGEGMLTRHLREGVKVGLLGRPCHERLRKAAQTPIGKKCFSSRRFHADIPYRPTEELLAEATRR